MSIQKHLNTEVYLKQIDEGPSIQYRVRNLSKNRSMKQLANNSSKANVLSKGNNKHTFETSFFSKQNFNELQIQSQQDLPKYQFNGRKQNDKVIKRNTSHRILRKVNSHLILPESLQSIANIPSFKDSFFNNQMNKVSLKKKVELIRRRHNEEKNNFFTSQPLNIKSEQALGDKKKSKSKLKILVRDPFQNKYNDRKKSQQFTQSRIWPVQDLVQMSQTNREQIQQFLSCLN